MKKLLTLIAAVALCGSAHAQFTNQLSFNNSSNLRARLADNATNSLALGSIIRIGNFGTNFSTVTNLLAGGVDSTELTTINGLFEVAFSTAIGSGTGVAGRVNTNFISETGYNNFINENLFVMFYNTSGDINTATQFALFQGLSPATFMGGGADNERVWTPDNSSVQTGNPLFGSTSGTTTGNEFWLTGAVIPEPGTVAALVAGLIALPFVRRMRKNS